MKTKFITVLFALVAATAMSASAAVIDLTFENIATYPWDSSNTYVQEF